MKEAHITGILNSTMFCTNFAVSLCFASLYDIVHEDEVVILKCSLCLTAKNGLFRIITKVWRGLHQS
jgi:hypothetical protein